MNAHTVITDGADGKMTSKGQVLIPKSVRDRVGLVPGGAVRVGVNDRGEAVVLPARKARRAGETSEQVRDAILAAAAALAGRYSTGQGTDAFMAEIRGPYDNLP